MSTAYEKRLTPLMGWASWNNYRIHINEELLKKQVDALVETGLADVGYTYFNIDDGFFAGRDQDGKIRSHPKRFPSGMKAMAEYIHDKGLKAGIYSDAGENTCAHMHDNDDGNTDGLGVGLYGYDEQDLRTYLVEWDYDFIKVDWCGGLCLKLDEKARYSRIGQLIETLRQEKGQDIIYNVCRWEFPGAWVVDVADSWRTSADIDLSFESVLRQIDAVKPLAQYHGPGHVNDLDMLQVGRGLSFEEDKTHFAMWCMMSTPLMLGNDLTSIAQETLEIVKNEELIAINQDKACRMPYVAVSDGEVEYWLKDLGEENGTQKAIAILNRSDHDIEVNIEWKALGLEKISKIRDAWNHQDIKVEDTFSVMVPRHATKVYRVQ
ncbi:glycoside hydrolase family 27 protein [Vallitaleaceae bacterium 9-2]